MSENKSKNIVIIALCITLIFMGVGFSLLSQTLTINGTARAVGSWSIVIDSIEAVKVKYAHTESTSSSDLDKFNRATGTTLTGTSTLALGTNLGRAYVNDPATTANFDALLNEPGDYVIYKVVVGNYGSIDAQLSNSTVGITMNEGYAPTYSVAAGGNDVFTVSFVDDQFDPVSLASLVSASQSNNLGGGDHGASGDEYYIKVTYNAPLESLATASEAEARATISFTYEQAQ